MTKLLRLVKSWYNRYMGIAQIKAVLALALVRCSIEADQGGTPHARARVNLVS